MTVTKSKILDYLTTVPVPAEEQATWSTDIYMGPEHWIDNDTTSSTTTTLSFFPSISAIIHESRNKTGIDVIQQQSQQCCEDLDQEWRSALQKAFAQHDDPKVAKQLEDYLQTNRSCGRKLKLQLMRLPHNSGQYFKIHAHPNLEFEVTLAGNLQEFRWLFTVDDAWEGDNPTGPTIAATHNFVHRHVPAGHCLVNPAGSVHQTFVGMPTRMQDGDDDDDDTTTTTTQQQQQQPPCCCTTILVLWSGCHANTPPSQVYNTDPRLQPKAGWG